MNDQYEVFRKDRSESCIQEKKGGGVLIAVKKYNDLTCSEITFNEIKPLEAVCIKITRGDSNIYVYAVYVQYRIIDDSLHAFYNDHITAIEALNNIATIKDTIIICGDFNFSNRISWIENDIGFDFIPILGESTERKTEIARHFTTTMMNNGLFQMSPYRNSSGNVLDLLYTNSPELAVVSKADFNMLPTNKSDICHVPLMCTIEFVPKVSAGANDEDSQHEIYSFRKANYDNIRAHLSTFDFPNVLNNATDLDDMVQQFYDILLDTFERFVPKSRIRSSNKPIWHNKVLASLKNKRNKEYKKLSKMREETSDVNEKPNDQPFLESNFKFEQYRKELHEEFIQRQAANLSKNPREFWKHLNGKRKSNSLPDNMNFNDKTAKTDQEKADLFADFFEDVYVKHDEDQSLHSFILNRNEENCHDFTIEKEHVEHTLRRMDINKGSGFDGVASIFLRECSKELTEPLTIIFSTSLEQMYYPTAFKIGQLTAIYKSGAKKEMMNYRGVNTVPNVAKVFDKVVRDQLKLIIAPRIKTTQHGFISNRNIVTNLCELTTYIYHAFGNHSQLDVIYTDVSKAFDHVDKSLQIKKLARFPLSNKVLFWFNSYLTDRKQYVRVGNATSRMILVSSGVGQGSVNGPFLFVAFFDDSDPLMDEVISLNFADDKKLAEFINNIEDAMQLQEGLNTFLRWCDDNKLTVNGGKCKVISFTRKKKPHHI